MCCGVVGGVVGVVGALCVDNLEFDFSSYSFMLMTSQLKDVECGVGGVVGCCRDLCVDYSS